MGIFRQLGEGDEHYEVGTDPQNCTGRNTVRTNCIHGDTPSGKILQRLELVEKSHIEYVRAHQTRLKARLDESEQLEQVFNQAINELRQEIYNLATEAESNGNGHHNGVD
ncbi:hypothetical protein H6G54_12115 [Anabaena cylindrica FACHB-243]|uniref:hypothetical protein n=1 Tax=Anabaena TaxID=1163 RepID=UPI0012371C69|nr:MULTISPECIES: hypothetical protein [Anabaena]MBD2418428.1 hypothetical protein [Anabaena cylindrica FACHB-243]MBY5284891.1 hypothetical protein [Anabaena sp. CCAP 1446/1C]MBY5307651.1 hypothetical protein [Anabaena sp. CCAP 1446/1C]MCM2409388.1 hypothetical protein [Anabaena sp. CCAP 1446/1C]